MAKSHVVKISKGSQVYKMGEAIISSLDEGELTFPELVRQAIRIVYRMGHFGAEGKGGRFSWSMDEKTGRINITVYPVDYKEAQ